MPVPVKPSSRPRGRPPRVSRDQILATALRIADEHGLEQLTMRRLGAELGFDPMTVYGHLSDKAALFDGLIELVLAEVEGAPAHRGLDRGPPRGRARGANHVLAHPHVVAAARHATPDHRAGVHAGEATTSILLEAGLSEEQAADGFDCLGRLIVGHALAEAGRPPGGEVGGGEREHRQAQEDLPAERYPALARVRRAAVRHDPNRLFELALDGLVLALSARLPTGTAPTAPR